MSVFWDGFGDELKKAWKYMLVLPWKPLEPDETDRGARWFYWLFGWAWAIAGLVLGALYAPSLLQVAGLSDTPWAWPDFVEGWKRQVTTGNCSKAIAER